MHASEKALKERNHHSEEILHEKQSPTTCVSVCMCMRVCVCISICAGTRGLYVRHVYVSTPVYVPVFLSARLQACACRRERSDKFSPHGLKFRLRDVQFTFLCASLPLTLQASRCTVRTRTARAAQVFDLILSVHYMIESPRLSLTQQASRRVVRSSASCGGRETKHCHLICHTHCKPEDTSSGLCKVFGHLWGAKNRNQSIVRGIHTDAFSSFGVD